MQEMEHGQAMPGMDAGAGQEGVSAAQDEPLTVWLDRSSLLIACACVAWPFYQVVTGKLSGGSFVQTVLGLAVAAAMPLGIAWLITRKRSAAVRAMGTFFAMLLVGVFMLGATRGAQMREQSDLTDRLLGMVAEEVRLGNADLTSLPARPPLPNLAQEKLRGDAKAAYRLLIAMRTNTDAVVYFNRKAAELNFSGILRPARLTSAEGLRESRGRLDEYTVLVMERGSKRQELREQVKAIADAPETPEYARAALNRSLSKNAPLPRVAERWDQACLDSARAVIAILSLAERNLGKITVRNGVMVFSDTATLAEYERLLAVASRAADQEQALLNELKALRSHSMKEQADRAPGGR